MKSCGLISGVQTPSQGNLNPPKWAVQSWQFSTQQGILGDVGWMTDFHPVHPASVGCQIGPFPCQPLDVLLKLNESSRMEDIRLSGRRNVYPWKLPLHARSPLATHQVTPGNNQALGRSPLTRPRKKKQWMLFWFNSTWAKMIAFIGSFKDDTCIPKPAKLDAWASIYLSVCLSVYLYIYTSIYLYIYVSIYLNIYITIHLYIYISIYLCNYITIYLYRFFYISISFYISMYLYFYIYISKSLNLNISISMFCDWLRKLPILSWQDLCIELFNNLQLPW